MYRVIVLAVVGLLSCGAQAQESDLTTQYNKFMPLTKSCTNIIDSIAAANAEVHKNPRVYEFTIKSKSRQCQDVYFTKKAPEVYVLYKLVYNYTMNNVRVRVFKALSLARIGKTQYVWDVKKVNHPPAKLPTNAERAEFKHFLDKFKP